MKEFEAKKKYYIHDWEAINDWFGNRGITLEYGDIKEWCYDGSFLYFICSDFAPDEIQSCEEYEQVVVCAFDSICYECDHVIAYKDSPFSNKLQEKKNDTCMNKTGIHLLIQEFQHKIQKLFESEQQKYISYEIAQIFFNHSLDLSYNHDDLYLEEFVEDLKNQYEHLIKIRDKLEFKKL